ncbi:MAG: MFS transporter [Chloroflexota bacterium]|nr:MFS transporter [Chloroflexota bacterium]
MTQPPNDPTTKLPNQSWQLLTFLFALANFLEVAVMAHFVLFTPAFLDAIGFSQAEITTWTGPIASAGFLSGIWFVPFWGVLADRYGRKPLILRSYYVEVVAMALAAVAQNVWVYLIARSLTGLALGNTGLMYAALTETAPRERVALALGLVNGSAPLGSLVGALAGGFLVSQYGVHWLFGIDAAVAALIAVVLTAFYRDVFVPKPTPHVAVMLRDALRAVIDSPVASTIFLVSFVSSAAFFFSFSYLPVRIGEIVGAAASATAIGITQGVAGATTLIGSAFLGLFADRIGHRRLLVALMLVVSLLWLPMYAAQGILGLTLVWAAFNAFSPSVSSLMFTIISLNVPAEKRGSVLSMIYLPMNLAFVVGPITASFVAQVEVRDVFLVSAALSLFALLIFVTNIRRTREVPNVATE